MFNGNGALVVSDGWTARVRSLTANAWHMAKECQAVWEREAALGLGWDEIAFYDALANNESAVRALGGDINRRRDHRQAPGQHHSGLAGA